MTLKGTTIRPTGDPSTKWCNPGDDGTAPFIKVLQEYKCQPRIIYLMKIFNSFQKQKWNKDPFRKMQLEEFILNRLPRKEIP